MVKKKIKNSSDIENLTTDTIQNLENINIGKDLLDNDSLTNINESKTTKSTKPI
jgi:hypothetical protein